MPATTTRQSAASRRSRTASSRCRPATPTSSMTSTAAPCTRMLSAASAATGASLVPAETTATVPARLGERAERRRAGHRVDVRLGQRGRRPAPAPPRRAGSRAPRARGAARAASAGSRSPGPASCRRRRPPRRHRCAGRGRRRRARSRGRRSAGLPPPEQASPWHSVRVGAAPPEPRGHGSGRAVATSTKTRSDQVAGGVGRVEHCQPPITSPKVAVAATHSPGPRPGRPRPPCPATGRRRAARCTAGTAAGRGPGRDGVGAEGPARASVAECSR